jgi:ABC-2 type transport system ATP-binding protein
MHRPSILFLDEPTAGLDPQSRIALWEILEELHDDGQTILLTTHYMEEADQLCHRLAIIDHGRVLALDTPAALKASIGADTFVRVTTAPTEAGTRQDLAERLTAALAGVTNMEVTDDGLRFGVKGSGGVLQAVLAAADQAGATVTDLRAEEPTLETVFIELTGKDLRE